MIESLSLLAQAEANDQEWQKIFDTCRVLGEKAVTISGVNGPLMHESTGQAIRVFDAVIEESEVGLAAVKFHLGVKRDSIFTGYEIPEEFRDEYRIDVDGKSYMDKLYWPDDPDTEPIMQRAWHAVSPSRINIFDAIVARSLQGMSLED